MKPNEVLQVGSKYSKNELARVLNEPSLFRLYVKVFIVLTPALRIFVLLILRKLIKKLGFTSTISSKVIISTGTHRLLIILDPQKFKV